MEHHEQPANKSTEDEALEPVVSRFAKHRFVVLIVTSIIISLVLVAISMQLYSSSGTAQLDLSRPGYKSVRDQIRTDDNFDGFPATGAIDDAALKNFKELYAKRAKEAVSSDAFSSDVLSEQALGIDAGNEE